MARYCFYCGRALKPGEKCGCRTTSQDHKTQQTSQESKENQTRPSKKKVRQPFLKRVTAFFNPSPQKNKKTGRTDGSASSNRSRSYESFRPKQTSKGHAVTFQSMLLFLTRPVDAIRTVHLSERTNTTGFILALNGLLTALFFYAASRQPQFLLIVQLNRAVESFNGWLVLIQGFVIGIVFGLLLAFLYLLAVRFILRQPLRYIALLNGISPALIYSSVFLLASLLVLPSSIMSALLTLVAGFGVSAIAQYIAIRRLTSVSDNRCFMLVALVLFFYSSILALILNQILPIPRLL